VGIKNHSRDQGPTSGPKPEIKPKVKSVRQECPTHTNTDPHTKKTG
jgi:hypothetical protein